MRYLGVACCMRIVLRTGTGKQVGGKEKKTFSVFMPMVLKVCTLAVCVCRTLSHRWPTPRPGAMRTTWVSFFLRCRLVYTEADTAVSLHTKEKKKGNIIHTPNSTQLNSTQREFFPRVVQRESLFRGLGIAIQCSRASFFSTSCGGERTKKKTDIFHLIPQDILCCVF